MKSSLTNMLASLTGLTLLVGAALGFVHELTAEPISKARIAAKNEAIAEILPPFDDLQTINSDDLVLYVATNRSVSSGMAIETYSDAGFGGRIVIMAGFDTDGKLVGYKVLSHAETPGLGAKIDKWFQNDQVIGSVGALAVRQDGGDIDAITGATITSRAFTDAINKARTAFNNYYNGCR